MAYRVEEYRAAVLQDYKQRKAAGELRHNLLHPTPGKLKDEVLYACSSRFKPSDEHILVKFFEQQKDQAAYLAVINKADPDDFRPLLNFLRGRTETPDMRQIELLAWLTDYTDRPYARYMVIVPEGQPQTAKTDEVAPDRKGEKPVQRVDSKELAIGSKIKRPKSSNLWKYTGLLLFFSMLVLLLELIPAAGQVYVCDSSGAKRYHLRKNCLGLRNCKHQIVALSLDSAKKTGRTLCHLEGG